MSPLVTLPYTPQTQTPISSAGVTSDFTTLYNLVNGLLDDANIASLTETKNFMRFGVSRAPAAMNFSICGHASSMDEW